MKLPNNIATKHKIRDARICILYADGNKTMEQISELFKLSPRRIGQILYKNIDFLKSNKEWEKTKRIVHLKRLLKNHPETLGKKGTLDIIEQLKDETEGSKNNDKGVNVTVVMNNVAIEGKPLEYRLGDLITS